MADNDSGALSPITKFLRFFLIVIVLIVIAQLALNPANRRPIVLCWPMYLVGKTVSVTAFSALFPDDPVFALQNVVRMENFFNSCVSVTSRIPGFERPIEASADPHAGGQNTGEDHE